MHGLGEMTSDITASDLDWPPSLKDWKKEQLKTGTRGSAWWIFAPLILIAMATAVGGVALVRSHDGSWLAPAAFATSVFFLIFSAVVPLGITRENKFEKAEKKECQEDCKDLYWALGSIGDHTLKGLAWVNFKQLRMFTVIAQKQARMSYYASLVAAAASLLVLIVGAAVAIGSPATSAKVTAAVLATVGTALSGFLAKTFLSAYQMASSQMSYYYGQPLVHCYLLHAEWLASEADKEPGDGVKARLVKKIVDASIKAAADAQGHLLTMQMSEQKSRGNHGGSSKAKGGGDGAAREPGEQ